MSISGLFVVYWWVRFFSSFFMFNSPSVTRFFSWHKTESETCTDRPFIINKMMWECMLGASLYQCIVQLVFFLWNATVYHFLCLTFCVWYMYTTFRQYTFTSEIIMRFFGQLRTDDSSYLYECSSWNRQITNRPTILNRNIFLWRSGVSSEQKKKTRYEAKM